VTMTTTDLRHVGQDASVRSVEELQARIGGLTLQRQQLRVDRAAGAALEDNRLALVQAQWELSHALIERYRPAA
jgi:uncharacterized small protein (DUF1192 family)